jgi:hypothetical protein
MPPVLTPNFGLIAIVRTNRTSCIMLKIEKEPKLNSCLFFVLPEVN